MSDSLKTTLVEMGCHVSSRDSKIIPSEVWKFDKKKSNLLNYNGDNFFDYAEKL